MLHDQPFDIKFMKRLAEFFFPAACCQCLVDIKGWGGSSICHFCLSKLSRASPALIRMSQQLTVASAFEYQGILRDILHKFKYQGRDDLVRVLVNRGIKGWEPVLMETDILVPVPTPFWRALRRGYNQAEVLAREVGLRVKKPVRQLLRRKIGFSSQTHLSRDQRFANARSSFCLKDNHRREKRCQVTLVDDLMTTGATLMACAELLRKAGYINIQALTLAREDRPRS